MKKIFLLNIICCCLFGCHYAVEDSTNDRYKVMNQNIETNVKYIGDGFVVTCPNNVTVEKTTPVEDFDIYKFEYHGKVILMAYAGNQPSFGDELDEVVSKKSGLINNFPFKAISHKKNTAVMQEVLIDFSAEKRWPMYIHYWIYVSALSDSEQKIAEDIIYSTK